jgi:hypothetical protein
MSTDDQKMFKTNPEEVQHLLSEIDRGALALPDFQRDFIWEAKNTARLLGSLLARYPAGALLTWSPGSHPLKERPFAGAPELQEASNRLVLDGQQRLTALYRSIYGKGDERFFLEVSQFMDPATFQLRDQVDVVWEKAIYSWEPTKHDRKAIADGKTPEVDTDGWQIRTWRFPLQALKAKKLGQFDDWIDLVVDALPEGKDARICRLSLRQVRDDYLSQLLGYEFPVITLSESASLRAVCQVFENLNTNAIRLGVFEILTAKFYPDEVDLRALWTKAKEDHAVLRDVEEDKDPEGFNIDPYLVLQAITLRMYRSPQQRAVLEKLTAEDVKTQWDQTTLALKRVVEHLRDNCGVIHRDLLPYQMLLVPLTAAWMERDQNIKSRAKAKALEKLMRYFWSSVFTQNFDQGGASQAEKDYGELIKWLHEETDHSTKLPVLPEAVTDALPISADTLLSATVRKTALMRATMALTVAAGAKDFHTGQRLTPSLYVQQKVNSHHLYPKARLADADSKTGIDAGGFSSELILNRALIDAQTNRRIGAKRPEGYVEEIRDEGTDVDDIFESHLIDVKSLEGADYPTFLQSRLSLVAAEIEALTGKAVLPLSEDGET